MDKDGEGDVDKDGKGEKGMWTKMGKGRWRYGERWGRGDGETDAMNA